MGEEKEKHGRRDGPIFLPLRLGCLGMLGCVAKAGLRCESWAALKIAVVTATQ